MLSLTDIAYLHSYFYDEMRLRGTLQVLKKEKENFVKGDKIFGTNLFFSKLFRDTDGSFGGIEIFNSMETTFEGDIELQQIRISDSNTVTHTLSNVVLSSGSTYLFTLGDVPDYIQRISDFFSASPIFDLITGNFRYELWINSVKIDLVLEDYPYYTNLWMERIGNINSPAPTSYANISQWHILNTAPNEYSRLKFHETIFYNNFDKKAVVGEMLRLIEYESKDEFCYSIGDGYNTGFVVNKNSPLYSGVISTNTANKLWEKNLNPLNKDKYPLLNLSGSLIYSEIGTRDRYFSFQNDTFEKGISNSGAFDEFVFPISPFYSYQVSCYIRVKEVSDFDGLTIRFGAITFDSNGNQVSLKNLIDSVDDNNFYEGSVIKNNQWYRLEAYIWQANGEGDWESVSNSLDNSGNTIKHKVFKNSSVCYIVPYIVSSHASIQGEVNIRGLELKPLNVLNPPCFLQGSKINQFWSLNRNKKWTKNEVLDLCTEFLLPLGYKNIFQNIAFEEGDEEFLTDWVDVNYNTPEFEGILKLPEGFETQTY